MMYNLGILVASPYVRLRNFSLKIDAERPYARGIDMRAALKHLMYVLGVGSILLFCVSASAGITYTTDSAGILLSEPVNMALFGIALIGIGSLAKSRLS